MAAKGEGVDVDNDVDPALAAFLEWRKGRAEPTIDHDAFGSTWQVPRSMPAKLWFFYQELRAQGRGINELTYGELDDLAPMVVPADVLAAWRELPLTLDELHRETIRLVFLYLFPPRDEDAEDGDASGEAETGSTSEASSSPTSDSSSATSSASTASTSSKRSKKKG